MKEYAFVECNEVNNCLYTECPLFTPDWRERDEKESTLESPTMCDKHIKFRKEGELLVYPVDAWNNGDGVTWFKNKSDLSQVEVGLILEKEGIVEGI